MGAEFEAFKEKHPSEASAYAEKRGWKAAEKISPNQILSILKENHKSGSLYHIDLLEEYLSTAAELTWAEP